MFFRWLSELDKDPREVSGFPGRFCLALLPEPSDAAQTLHDAWRFFQLRRHRVPEPEAVPSSSVQEIVSPGVATDEFLRIWFLRDQNVVLVLREYEVSSVSWHAAESHRRGITVR